MNKILLLSLLLITTIHTFGQQNLIKNGGFENNFQHWKVHKGNGAIASFMTDPRNKQIGQFSLKVYISRLGTNIWDVNSTQQFLSKKDRRYKVTLSAKTRFSGKKIRLQVQNNTQLHKDLELTNKWNNYSWEFNAKENNLELALQFIQEGTFFVDNIIIKEIKKGKSPLAAKKNKINKGYKKSNNTSKSTYTSKSSTKTSTIIENGNFESGLSNWVNEQYNGSYAKFSLNKRSPYAGKNCLRVMTSKFGSNHWDIQSVKKINVKRNKSYKLQFYAKANGSGKKVKVQIQDNPNKIYLVKEFSINKNWQKYEWSFTAETNTMEVTFQHISKGTMDFDNISFTSISRIKNPQR